jgi:hypothetical protein
MAPQEVEALSKGWIHFLEGFVMLMAGMAPTFQASDREKTPNPHLEKCKKDFADIELWLKPPRGYKFTATNQRMTMYEAGCPENTEHNRNRFKKVVSDASARDEYRGGDVGADHFHARP